MLTQTIEWSLKYRWVVLAATAGLVVAGLLAFRALPIDAFPDTTPTQVQVNAVAPALTPIEVEQQLTIPIEQVLAGLPRVEEMRSLSKFGLSQVTVRFSDETNLWFARQVVAERLGNVALPPGIDHPALGPVATGLGEVFHYLVKSQTKTLEELRTLHDWVIAPQLRSVSGVAEINAWGGDEKQWHVVVDPRRLQKFDLSLGDLYLALEQNNANVGGGVIESGGGASLVLGVGVLDGRNSISEVVIAAREGVPIRVRDVATVEIGREIRRGATTADGEGEAVLGLGFMLVGENSHAVTRALAARLEELEARLPDDVLVEPVYERTELVDHVLRTVKTNLFEGALLVIAVLFIFLGNVRAGLIVAAAIPLSMLFAFNAMLRFGVAGTLMSLGAIDFGLIVDSSVILIENAERRLAESSDRRSVIDVVRDAAVEVRKPTLFGELIIMVVYLPILTLESVEGKLFRPMALTVIFALLGSTLISMTLMPALASLFLRKGGARGHGEEPRIVSALKRRYRPILGWALTHTKFVLCVAAAIVVGAALAATRLGSEFVPRLSEGTIVINTVRLAEVSLTESVRYGTQIEQVILQEFPAEVKRVWTRSGTAEVATDPMGIELSDVFITLKPRSEWQRAHSQEELVAEMTAELADMPGMRMAFLQPIEMRVNEMIAGVRSDLAIKIFGDDLDVLRAIARQAEGVVRAIPGAADVTVEQVTGQPVLEVRVDRAAIARYGIPAHEVLDVVAAVGTRITGEVREGERRFDLAVRLTAEFRDDPAKLATVLVSSPTGERVPLGRLATIREVSGPTTIQREWGKRRVVVQANVRERDLGSFVREVRAGLAGMELPPGYYFRYGGQFENLERSQRRLLIVVPISLALIFGLLYVTYRRVIDSLRIFTGVPFAMVGGVIALLLRGLPFSISAAVGFIALSGVSVLGDMVLVSRVRQLLDQGRPLDDAIREAAVSRLRPVLMTAAVAAIGFLPMAFNTGIGAEVQRPLATVVIGGVVSSTLLTLVVLPVLYAVFGGGRRQKSVELEQDHDDLDIRATRKAHVAP
jgi:cobalt-zinc-cadmium resistance protein CzcA